MTLVLRVGKTTLPAPQKLAEFYFPMHPPLFSQDRPCSDLFGKDFWGCVLIVLSLNTIIWKMADILGL